MFYEDFQIDKLITTRSRVVTGTDIDLFAGLTHAVNPLFLSDEFAKSIGQPARLVPGPLLFALTIGLCYQAGLFDHVIAMAGVDELRFLSSVHPGNMITATAAVLEKRATKKLDRGIVVIKHELKKQQDAIVLTAKVTYLMRTKQSA